MSEVYNRGSQLVKEDVAFDATFPADWPADEVPAIMDFENGWPREIQLEALARWREYGIKLPGSPVPKGLS